MKTRNLIATCAILAATLAAAVVPVEARTMTHHGGMMMGHHRMHSRYTAHHRMMRPHMMSRHHRMMHRAM